MPRHIATHVRSRVFERANLTLRNFKNPFRIFKTATSAINFYFFIISKLLFQIRPALWRLSGI